MGSPEYRQLSLELLGLALVEPLSRRKRSKAVLRVDQSNEILLDLFELTEVPPPKQIARGRGLKFDNELTQQCQQIVEKIGLNSLAKKVKVYWNLRLCTTAGLAHHSNGRIDLNPRLEQFTPEEPERTLRHELAHLVAHHRAAGRRIQPHGTEWQHACDELGIPGEKRCHDFPLASRVIKRKLAYRCKYCGTVVPRVRKISRESACYPCCLKHNGGEYSRRFLLEKISIEEARLLVPEHDWA